MYVVGYESMNGYDEEKQVFSFSLDMETVFNHLSIFISMATSFWWTPSSVSLISLWVN